MRKALALTAALVMMLTAFSFAAAEEAEWTVQTTPVWRGEKQTGMLDLRFCPASRMWHTMA